MPPRPQQFRGPGAPKAKNSKKTLLRLLSYLKRYSVNLILVLIAILASSISMTYGQTALGTIVDNYLTPMLETGSQDFSGLTKFLTGLVGVYAISVIATFLQNFLMVRVTQGVQKTVRDDMFTKMQKLPIRYFDTNTAGNIMSRYTSDIDTLRQMISQSIPQAISSCVTLVVVLITMLRTSWLLTLVTLVTVFGIIKITAYVVGKAGKYFAGQQKSLGAVNGYIEEMISGQKVVKVFNHEEVCKEEFDKLNEELYTNAFTAGKYSNAMGPINNNLG